MKFNNDLPVLDHGVHFFKGVPPTQWTWIWANSRRQWRTENSGMLQSMGSQRVGLDLASEQQDPYHEVFPRGRNLSPKEKPVSHPEESGNKRVLKKKRKLSSREEPLSSGPEEVTASKSRALRKRKCSESYPRKIRINLCLMRHNLER